jgi:hypothetical protein
VDATDYTGLVALGEGSFPAVVCTMALMDMAVIAPFYQAARRLLRADGRLVVATAHPAFNSNGSIFFAEMAEQAGSQVTTHEPTPHYVYHRPLHHLLGEAFAAGLVLDALEEPAPRPEEYGPARPLSWSALPQIPPVLAYRLRLRA